MSPISPTPCPAGDVIAAFASGELPADGVHDVQQHLSQCDACLEVVGHLASRSLASNSAPAASVTSLAAAGQVIGPYQLIRRVGEGGMGEVWAAQQTSPVRRLVALKLLKAGMDTRQVVARFEAERQMLALMQHPGIAQIFDAGITDAGRPYFAMEFVNGERITSYCDSASLGLPERLRLFQLVCDAVQHAHQKGVIHRDIKPSNILVTLQDGKTQPKVIDFGLAKATTAELKDASLTELGTTLGTPAYASPEQMSLGAVDVDTRSDVYSLGVVLYELLIGVIPFEMDQASYAAMVELRRSIREQDPLRPSVRLSKLGVRADQVASERRTELPVLRRQLERELDWIVMKALEKNRERRYASPKDLAADIQRFLDNEPLVAGPPTTEYRVRKFVQRHRVGTAIAAVFVGLIAAFVTVTLVQSQRIAQERDRAEAEAAKANSINEFLTQTLSAADPWQSGADVSIRETLAQAAKRTSVDFKDEPLLAAAVQTVIGDAYVGLGQVDAAEPLIRDAMAVRIRHLGADHIDVAHSRSELAELLRERGLYREAAEQIALVLATYRETYGPDDLRVANILSHQSQIHYYASQYDAALKAAEECLVIRERKLGPTSPGVADCLENLGAIESSGRGDMQKAEQHHARALEINRNRYGDKDVRTTNSLKEMGTFYQVAGRHEEARAHLAQARAELIQLVGASHPTTVVATENLANTLGYLKRFDESVPLLREVLAMREKHLGSDSPQVTRTMINLSGHYMDSDRLDEARALMEIAMPRFAQAYGEDNTEYAQVLSLYGRILVRQREFPRAEATFRQALSILLNTVGEQHRSTAAVCWRLGDLLATTGKDPAEGESLLMRAYESRKALLGPSAPGTKEVAVRLAALYEATGRSERARTFAAIAGSADPG